MMGAKMNKVRLRSAGLCIVAGLLCPTLQAQESDSPAQAPAAKPAESGSSFFGRLTGSVKDGFSGLVGGVPEKPLIAVLPSGAYAASNEALGEDRDVESKRVRQFGLVPAPLLQAYVDGIYQRLKEASGVQAVPGRVHLTPSSELDASSTADGNAFVSLGYLRALRTEDELAALLAHELSHVLLRHHDSNIFGKLQKQLQTVFAAGSTIKNQLDQLDRAQQSGTVSLSASQTRTMQRMQLGIMLTDHALHPAWNRRQETEADRLAYDLLVKAGYAPAAMNRWLQVVADWEEVQNKKKAQAQAEVQSGVDLLVSSGKLDLALNKGVKNAGDVLLEQLQSRHEDAIKRIDDLGAYTAKHYPSVPRLALKPAQHLSQASHGQLLSAYDDVFKAMQLEADNQPGDALKLLSRLTAKTSPVAQHALPNLRLYELMRRMNKEREGLSYLSRSLEAPEPVLDAFKQMALLNKRNGDRTAVLRTGEMAMAKFKKAPALYPELIAFYSTEGYPEQARELLNSCTLTLVEYREACNKAFQAKP